MKTKDNQLKIESHRYSVSGSNGAYFIFDNESCQVEPNGEKYTLKREAKQAVVKLNYLVVNIKKHKKYGIQGKSYGRIFVFDKNHIQIVHEVLRKMDEHEYHYCPSNAISVFNDDFDDLVYLGKFDCDVLELIQRCAERKVGILVRYKPHTCEYPIDYLTDL